MSWSIQAIGKGGAVGRSLQKQFDSIPEMQEPEKTIKNKVAEIVSTATSAAPGEGFMVRAEGTQWSQGGVIRQLHLKVEIDLLAFAE